MVEVHSSAYGGRRHAGHSRAVIAINQDGKRRIELMLRGCKRLTACSLTLVQKRSLEQSFGKSHSTATLYHFLPIRSLTGNELRPARGRNLNLPFQVVSHLAWRIVVSLEKPQNRPMGTYDAL